MSKQRTNITYGFVILSLSIILTGILFISKATRLISQQFYDVFIPISISVTILWAIVLFLETRPGLEKVFGFNEVVPGVRSSTMPLSMKILLFGGGLAFLFSVGAVGLGSPIIDIPQPFVSQALSAVTGYDQYFYQALIPGFFEESVIYMIVSSAKYILLFAFGARVKPGTQLIIFLVAAAIGAAIMTQGHRVAYGSDSSLYLNVFMFSLVVQFMNLYTGAFISWIPHITHNAAVIYFSLVAFTIGGQLLAGFIRRHKHGQR